MSTDDKGQRPERQEEIMQAWAQREGQTLLQPIRDVGTSATFTSPFERPKFLLAVESAKQHGAVGILAEKVDRICGQGSDELGWVRYELRKKHGLRLAFADRPLSMQGHDNLGGNIASHVDAEVRRERIATDRIRIKSGIATRKAKGLPIGGQTQTKLDPDLVAMILSTATANPLWGIRRIAREVSIRRGSLAAGITATEARKRKVSASTIRRVLLRDPRTMEIVFSRNHPRSVETSPKNPKQPTEGGQKTIPATTTPREPQQETDHREVSTDGGSA